MIFTDVCVNQCLFTGELEAHGGKYNVLNASGHLRQLRLLTLVSIRRAVLLIPKLRFRRKCSYRGFPFE